MTRHTPTELREMAEMLVDFRIETQARRDKQSDKIASMLRQAADDAEDAERYRWLQKSTAYRFKKMQDASIIDGMDVIYFNKDAFDSLVDAARKETP